RPPRSPPVPYTTLFRSSMVALSDSSVIRPWSFSTVSPGATRTSITGTSSKPPMSGTRASWGLAIGCLHGRSGGPLLWPRRMRPPTSPPAFARADLEQVQPGAVRQPVLQRLVDGVQRLHAPAQRLRLGLQRACTRFHQGFDLRVEVLQALQPRGIAAEGGAQGAADDV